ncbi:hypothetical protein HF521_015456 [Silurus meridionalis]|uniref:Immunoglobulin V-set domain-containing protein n=1 Tax=Silurus meridionalis TaxID=175797 RepID=A0A8T0A7Y7_SILME|nr:hypothetical protein HF521_015456 [Silurus meridionalis]
MSGSESGSIKPQDLSITLNSSNPSMEIYSGSFHFLQCDHLISSFTQEELSETLWSREELSETLWSREELSETLWSREELSETLWSREELSETLWSREELSETLWSREELSETLWSREELSETLWSREELSETLWSREELSETLWSREELSETLWFYGPEKAEKKILNSQMFKGETVTEISERFKEKLQLNRTSGALTIRNISRNHSGIYLLHVITEDLSSSTFRVVVLGEVFHVSFTSMFLSHTMTSEDKLQHQEDHLHMNVSCSPFYTLDSGWLEE